MNVHFKTEYSLFEHCSLEICNKPFVDTYLRMDTRVAETCKYTRLTVFKI